MLVREIVRRVRNSAGDVGVLQFDNLTLTDWINDAIRECVIENTLLQARATTPTVVGTFEYTLPADILRFHSIWYDRCKLKAFTLQEWEEYFSLENESGSPVGYYVYAGKLFLGPTPDAVKDLTLNYSRIPAPIAYVTSPVEGWNPDTPGIPETFHNRIVTYCLAQVAYQDDDYAKYDALMVEFRTGVSQLKDMKDQEDDLYPFISISARDSGMEC